MPTQVGGMYVGLTAEFQQYEQAFNRATTTTEQGTARIRRATDITARSVSALERSMSGFGGGVSGAHFASLLAAGRAFENMSSRVSLLRGTLIAATGAFAGFTGALTTNVVARYADAYVNLNNQVLAVSKTSAEARASFGGIAQVAERSRSSLESTTLLYSRIAKASSDMDPTQVLRYVETIQKAMQLGGATAQEARSAAIQFSQAIASNRLGGEEFRAIMETPLGLELAKGLGVSIGKLREMSIEGKLTAQTILGALSNIAPGIDAKFSKIAVSLDQALTVADNKLMTYVGAVDQAYGVTKNLGASILAFGNNLSTIMPIVAALGGLLAANLGARLLAAPVRGITTGFGAEIKARRDELASLQSEAKTAATRLVDAGLMRSRASAATFGDQSQYASPATLSNIAREERVLSRLEAERVSLLEKQKKIQGEIASVTAPMSARAVALAEKQAKAENAVADGLIAQAEAKKKLSQAQTRETAALGMAATTGAGRDSVVDARRARVSVEKELQRVISDTARQQRTAASVAEQVATMTTAAEQKAVQQRINLIKQEGDVRRQLGVNYVMRTGQSEDIGALRGAAYQEGASRNRDTLRGADINLRTAAESYRNIGSEVAIASQRATAGAVAVSMLRNSWTGLIGALGGPWGIAVTAAIAGLGYIGARSMKTAQEIQDARNMVQDFIERQATSGTAGPDRQQAQIDQINRQIEQQEDRLRKVQRLASGSAGALASASRDALAPLFDYTAGVDLPVQRQINTLVSSLRDGRLAFDDFIANLRALGVSSAIIDKITASVKAIPTEARNASGLIKEIRSEIERLDGQKATITIDVVGGAVTSELVRTAEEAKSAAEYLRKQEIEQSAKAAAAGGNKLPLYRLEATKEASTAGVKISADDIERMAQARIKTDEITEATSRAKREATSAGKAYEKLSDALARLSAEAKGSRLLDVDREVLERAKGMKFKASDMEAYVTAAETGNFSGVNPDLMKLRDAMTTKSSGSMARNLIQEYGKASDLTREFAQRQEELNKLVEDNVITKGQAATEMGKYIASFGNYSWVTDLSSAIGTFAGSAITNFNNIGSAVESLKSQLINMVVQMAVVKPLTNALTGMFGSVAGSNFSGLTLSSLYHEGTSSAGYGASGVRAMPTSAFQYAPRFHQGLLPDELTAVLKRGEAVLNDRTTGQVSNTVAGLADAAAPRDSGLTVNVTNNAGAEVKQRATRGANGKRVLEVEINKVIAGGGADKSMRGRYGTTPKRTAR